MGALALYQERSERIRRAPGNARAEAKTTWPRPGLEPSHYIYRLIWVLPLTREFHLYGCRSVYQFRILLRACSKSSISMLNTCSRGMLKSSATTSLLLGSRGHCTCYLCCQVSRRSFATSAELTSLQRRSAFSSLYLRPHASPKPMAKPLRRRRRLSRKSILIWLLQRSTSW